MKYLFFLVFVTMSCVVAKPPLCITKIVINYRGPTDKPISPLVFTIQDKYSSESDGPYAYVIVVNRDEFDGLSKVIANFKNVAGTKNPADIQSFGVLIADSCKQKSFGTYGRSNSISFLNNLIETTESFRPEVKATAKEFTAITRNRL